MPTLTLSRRMGTSLKMIEEHYGHLVPDEDEVELARFNAFDAERGGRRELEEEAGR